MPRHLFEGLTQGGLGILRDLHELTSCVAFVEACWTILLQAARASHDRDLEQTCRVCGAETLRQRAWLKTKLGQVAPQALTVPVSRPHEQRVRSSAAAALPRAEAPNVSRSTQAPLVVGIIAGLGQAVASRRRGRRKTRASTVSSILAGVGLGWAGSTVIRAFVDGPRRWSVGATTGRLDRIRKQHRKRWRTRWARKRRAACQASTRFASKRTTDTCSARTGTTTRLPTGWRPSPSCERGTMPAAPIAIHRAGPRSSALPICLHPDDAEPMMQEAPRPASMALHTSARRREVRRLGTLVKEIGQRMVSRRPTLPRSRVTAPSKVSRQKFSRQSTGAAVPSSGFARAATAIDVA